MFTATIGKWHIWEGSSKQIMLSDEDTSTLTSHADMNWIINFLYITACDKEAARELGRRWKAHNAK